MAHLVADNLLLTSNLDLSFSIRSLHCEATLNLMSTVFRDQMGHPAPACGTAMKTSDKTLGLTLCNTLYKENPVSTSELTPFIPEPCMLMDMHICSFLDGSELSVFRRSLNLRLDSVSLSR